MVILNYLKRIHPERKKNVFDSTLNNFDHKGYVREELFKKYSTDNNLVVCNSDTSGKKEYIVFK